MIAVWLFCGVAITLNSASVSSSILTSMRDDGALRIFKEPRNELEYVLKRSNADTSDEPDSKERRSSMGASFIRFGRAGSRPLLSGEDSDPQINRLPRSKSPDIVIRFGRSGAQNIRSEEALKRARSDLNFIRFGRNVQVLPEEIDLPLICSELLPDEPSKHQSLYMFRLFRLCSILQSIDDDRRSHVDFLDEVDSAVARRD